MQRKIIITCIHELREGANERRGARRRIVAGVTHLSESRRPGGLHVEIPHHARPSLCCLWKFPL